MTSSAPGHWFTTHLLGACWVPGCWSWWWGHSGDKNKVPTLREQPRVGASNSRGTGTFGWQEARVGSAGAWRRQSGPHRGDNREARPSTCHSRPLGSGSCFLFCPGTSCPAGVRVCAHVWVSLGPLSPGASGSQRRGTWGGRGENLGPARGKEVPGVGVSVKSLVGRPRAAKPPCPPCLLSSLTSADRKRKRKQKLEACANLSLTSAVQGAGGAGGALGEGVCLFSRGLSASASPFLCAQTG